MIALVVSRRLVQVKKAGESADKNSRVCHAVLKAGNAGCSEQSRLSPFSLYFHVPLSVTCRWLITPALIMCRWLITPALIMCRWLITPALIMCRWLITPALIMCRWLITPALIMCRWLITPALILCRWLITPALILWSSTRISPLILWWTPSQMTKDSFLLAVQQISSTASTASQSRNDMDSVLLHPKADAVFY